jgi:hypothetical protein
MMPKCSRCHAIKPDQCFGLNAKGEFYKTCVNCREKSKEYRNAEWKEKNKEKTKMYQSKTFQNWLNKPLEEQRVDCPCGRFYRYKAKHLETKCHKDYLERLRLEESTTAGESDEPEDVYACYYEGSDENEEGTCGHYVLSDSDAD